MVITTSIGGSARLPCSSNQLPYRCLEAYSGLLESVGTVSAMSNRTTSIAEAAQHCLAPSSRRTVSSLLSLLLAGDSASLRSLRPISGRAGLQRCCFVSLPLLCLSACDLHVVRARLALGTPLNPPACTCRELLKSPRKPLLT